MLHPVTQAYRQLLRQMVADGKDHWAQGAFTAATIEASVMLNAKALGKLEVLEGLAELDFQGFEESFNERAS